jgi:spore germination cell wall hydrolase CwlJ-like protein
MNSIINTTLGCIVLMSIIFMSQRAWSSDMDEVGCLAEAIYFEARGEDIVGMIAVGQVIINRVNDLRFDDTICGVVHAGHYYENYPVRNRCQFSYWCDGKHERYGDIKAFEMVMIATQSILDNIRIEGLEYATHYHASHVTPYWSQSFTRIRQIGGHVFYEPVN